jgi:hypothetical protein
MTKRSIHDNIGAIRDFCIYWQGAGILTHGNVFHNFPCSVTYYMKGVERYIDTRVLLSREGVVELSESGWLNSVDHHLGFDADWQTFSLTPGHALHIAGRSDKVGGSYWVEIVPTED